MNDMLSVIIPAREEIYLEKTIRNILENARGEIEVIVELDGWIPYPQIKINDDRVRFVHHEEVIGQRACINHGAKVSKGKYIMKLDAHCAVDEGFDVKLAADCEPDWTVIPRMYNLDVKTWEPKRHKRTDYMYVTSPDAEKPFRAMYYSGHQKPKSDKLIDETMCNMGPGWFMHKEQFFKQGGCDEGHEGGWGQQGIEVSLKAWLSGGKLIVNKKTWFSHWFRGGGGPGFPYKISGNQINRVRAYSRDLWLNDKWPLATRKLKWLVDKFDPPGWNERKDMTILFYSANIVSKKIMEPVVRSLKRFNYPIVSVTQEPMPDLGRNFVVPKERSLQNIYRQVLRAAKEATTKYVALCEDDCLYTKEHFLHEQKKPFAYNLNRWLLHLDEGIYSYRKRPILSQCLADRQALIDNLEERMGIDAVADIPDKHCGEMGVFDKQIGIKEEYEYETFESPKPNLVVCHKNNTKRNRKLLGTDAEPRKELEQYGDVDYWLKKFGALRPKKIRKQVSFIAGRVLAVDDILDNIDKYWDYRKKDRIPYYKSSVAPFFEQVHAGKTFTDAELKAHPYFEYLLYRMRPEARDRPEVKDRCLFLMRSGIKLYHNIKENGMYQPIDMFWRGMDMHIYRGTRRIAIAKLLGYKHITARVFKSLDVLGKLMPERDDTPSDTTIHGMAMMQFNRYGYKGTDKYWTHGYTPLYDFHIAHMKDTAKKILEIGVFHGASLLLWKDFFPKAQVYGVDKNISKASMIQGVDRITLFEGRQGDKAFFEEKVIPHGKFDLIIDDCSHNVQDQKNTLELMWDSVAPGGFYVIEDMYWRGIKDPSAMNKLKDMIDEMNRRLEIDSIHFYYNIAFVRRRK